VIISGTTRRRAGTASFAGLLDAAPLAPQEFARTRADDFAFWLYSSGSTAAQGTVHSHAICSGRELYGKPILGIRESDLVFSREAVFAYGLAMR